MTHVVLTGFMGVGKTAVGRRLARRLGRPFIDTDQLIEEAAGKPISKIFDEDGEDYFRDLERRIIAELEPDTPAVISTGGGTFANATNRKRLEELGVTVCLMTKLETILERVQRNDRRPLAQGPEGRKRLERLLKERMPSYRKADVLIETDSLSIDQSMQRVLNMIEPRLKQGELGEQAGQTGQAGQADHAGDDEE